MSSELSFMPAMELAEAIRNRQVSSVEVTRHLYERIERLDPRLNSYLALCQDQAMADARAADDVVVRGWATGPLHGVPISIKDLEMTKGIPTTLGSAVYRDRVPDIDSIAVERVKAAGAVVLGKTNTPEFGQVGYTENKLGEPCRNPWNTERTPGGSSGGAAAALAAGLCTMAVGSDGGGSIRIPASFSGLFGIKPTQNRVPRFGGYGRPASSQISQTGPLSRTVADAALLLQVMAGPDSRDASSIKEVPPDFSAGLGRGVGGMRIAWSPDFGYAAVDPEVAEITARAARVFEELGAIVEDAPLKLEDPGEAFYDLLSTGAYASYGHLLEEHRAELDQPALEAIENGSKVDGARLSRAILRADQLGRQMEDFFDTYDLLLSPTLATPAFVTGEPPAVIDGREVSTLLGFLPFTFPINMTGQTASSIPCGFSADGLPIGLQIIGPRRAEARVLQASAAFERARPWSGRKPPGFE